MREIPLFGVTRDAPPADPGTGDLACPQTENLGNNSPDLHPMHYCFVTAF